MKIIAALVASTALVGCASMQPQTYIISGEFDEQYARQQIADGEGSILGTAFLRQQGGGVVTCAGQDTHLIPITGYATDRLTQIYGSEPLIGSTSYRDARTMGPVTFVPDIPAYRESTKVTKCDAQGNFEFANIKDGEYYITTGVVWVVGARQGGALATKVKVHNGKSSKVIMTR